MTSRHLRRTAAAILATTTSVVPIALWAQPAAAAPVADLTGDACSVSGTVSEPVDFVALRVVRPNHSVTIAEADGSSIAADYGEWLVANGDTVVLELTAYADNQLVAADTLTGVGPCATGSAFSITATDVGTAPSPSAGTYGLYVAPCDEFGSGIVASLSDGETAVVPVPPGMELCTTIGSFNTDVVGLDIDPRVATAGLGQTVPVAVTADWIGQRVLLPAVPVGLPDGPGVSWSTSVAGSFVDSEPCEVHGDELDCDGFPRIRPGGTFELYEEVPGWHLAQTSFTEADCTAVHLYDRDWCQLPVSFVSEGGPTPPPPPPPAPVCDAAAVNPFVDVDPSGTHSANVVCAADLGLVRGGPAGLAANRFGPTLTTSRAQLATLVRNLLLHQGVVLPQGAPNAFADDAGSVHEASIDTLHALGVIGGNGEAGSSYFPSRPATRSEIASFLHRAYTVANGAPLPAGPDVFGDDEGDPAEDAINALAAAGVLSGKAPGVFDPNGTVTREQIATLFVQLVAALA